jgi:AcrR family transcriptional regulator
MAPEKRTRLSPQARREQLIALGVQMLATRTLDELSVEDIAHQAGISRGLLFHYFASKQEFHLEVARAAAQELIRRTAPDPDRPAVTSLHGAVTAFIEYVEENPDSYKSLVRGAASGDAQMRAIFDDTRATQANRLIGMLAELGLPVNATTELAVHGWVAYAEECAIRWLGAPAITRPELLDMLTKSLPAVVLATSAEQVAPLGSIVTAQSAAVGR